MFSAVNYVIFGVEEMLNKVEIPLAVFAISI